jgi:hypothetical protein
MPLFAYFARNTCWGSLWQNWAMQGSYREKLWYSNLSMKYPTCSHRIFLRDRSRRDLSLDPARSRSLYFVELVTILYGSVRFLVSGSVTYPLTFWPMHRGSSQPFGSQSVLMQAGSFHKLLAKGPYDMPGRPAFDEEVTQYGKSWIYVISYIWRVVYRSLTRVWAARFWSWAGALDGLSVSGKVLSYEGRSVWIWGGNITYFGRGCSRRSESTIGRSCGSINRYRNKKTICPFGSMAWKT